MNRCGYTVLEVVVALFIFSVAAVCAARLFGMGARADDRGWEEGAAFVADRVMTSVWNGEKVEETGAEGEYGYSVHEEEMKGTSLKKVAVVVEDGERRYKLEAILNDK